MSALLIFSQESHFYLTGYDSVGYLFFQCAVLTADEQSITLLTRRPDLQQAKDTSIIEDIRIWYNAEDANPALDLKAILEEKGLAGERIGVELDTYGLTGANWELVRRALNAWCVLEDASDIVRRLRVVKSPSELVYVREAAKLADLALVSMVEACRPGRLESQVAAAGLQAILGAGGDPPPAGPLVNAGRRALYGRSVCGPQTITNPDQVALEYAGTYRRYNCCMYRTVVIGRPKPAQLAMFKAVRETITAMTEAARPGQEIGEIDTVHRRLLDAHGHAVHRLSACGYSLGATYRPSWMDVPPMIYVGNRTLIEPGMTLFIHAFVADASTGLAMAVGHTLEITTEGNQVLSAAPLEFLNRS